MKREWASPAAVVSAFLLLPLIAFAIYAAGYFWLGTRLDLMDAESTTIVFFDGPWRDDIYGPAAKVESLVTRRKLYIWEVSSESQ